MYEDWRTLDRLLALTDPSFHKRDASNAFPPIIVLERRGQHFIIALPQPIISPTSPRANSSFPRTSPSTVPTMISNFGSGTYRPARTCVVAVTIIASAYSVMAQAGEQVVTIRLTPDPLIEMHIRKIQGAERILQLSISKPHDSRLKSQNVSVRGPIPDSHISDLVRSVVAGSDQYWTNDYSWTLSVVGDEQYAILSVSRYCGELCGCGARYTYAFKDGRWTFEYTSHQWIS